MLYTVSFFNPLAQEETTLLVNATSEKMAKVIGWAAGNPYEDIDHFPFYPDDFTVRKYKTIPDASYETAIDLIGKAKFEEVLNKLE